MADRAKITSVEALESFQNVLVVYLDKAKRTMDEISDEVKRTRTWVESDRRVHWKHEVKRRTRVVGILPNDDALLRLASAVLMEVDEHWMAGRKYLTMETS